MSTPVKRNTVVLRHGERHPIWAKPGPVDPAGPYQMRFVSAFSEEPTPWVDAVQDTYPDGTGQPGIYVWAANGVTTGNPDDTTVLPPGGYTIEVHYTPGSVLDIEPLPDLLRVE